MTFSEYQKLAARTMNPGLNAHQTLDHALRGLAAACGEVEGIFQKVLQGHELNMEDLKKEIGDVLWMIEELCTVEWLDMEEIDEGNIEKLRKRYPEGFSAERSVKRDV